GGLRRRLRARRDPLLRRGVHPGRRARGRRGQRAVVRAEAGRGCEGLGVRLLRLRAQRLPAAPSRPGARPGRYRRRGERGPLPSGVRHRPRGEAVTPRRRTLVAVALVAGLARAALGGEPPRVVVEKMTQAALDILARKGASSDEKRHALEELAYANADF